MYDIDKESVYWADSENLFNNNIDNFNYSLNKFDNYSPTDLNKVLLKLEKQILTHPRNAHFLLLPVIDDLLKKDAFDAVVSSDAKKPTTFFDALTPSKNVEKAIHFIKSKLGVGVVALDITGHSIFTSENIKMLLELYDKNGDLLADRHLMFDGMYNNDSLSSIYDASNRLISEIQSQTMTSQVDAGKDPYAVLLGINSQTLGPVMYLVRRGVPIIQILKFVSHPIIKRYLELQRINESITNKQRGKELDKQTLIKNLYSEFGIQEPDFRTFVLNKEEGFTDEDLDPKNKTRQYEIFKYFLEIVDETTQFNRLKNALTADTKGRKDRAAVIQFDLLWKAVRNDNLIPLSDLAKLYEKSVIAPFFTSQSLYKRFYDSLYAIKTQLDDIIERTESGLKADKREKFISTLHNDFMLYLIQNYNPDFNRKDFDTLLGYTNEPSLAMELKGEEGFLFNQLYALMSVEKDTYSGKMTDIVRLFERSLNSMDTNDLIDAMLDLKTENKELYEKLIRASLYQAGFNNSPFSLTKIIPAVKSSKRKNNKLEEIELDYLYEIQKQAVEILNTLPIDKLKNDIKIFEQLFFRNNPTYLRTKPNKNLSNRLFYVYDEVQSKFVIKYIPVDTRQSQKELVQLGNAYKKRYFRDEYVDIFDNVIENEKSVLNNVFEETQITIDIDYEDVTEPKPKALPASTKTINIYAGTNENAELSNFAVRPFTATLGVEPLGKFQTVEGAFQAAKLLYTDEGLSDSNKNILKELQTASGSKAESIGRSIEGLNKEEWDENSSEIMKDLIKQFFEQNPDALSKLLATGNATLIYTQDKSKWGTKFPKLLMEVREGFKKFTGNTLKQLPTSTSKVVEGDIFALPGIPVITTNLGGVHGAGLAQAAKARGLIKQGDGDFKATESVVQLPVKKKWSDSMAMNNNIELLKESLRNLIRTARNNKNNTYLLPLAGLGHGEGSIEDILPLLIKTVQSENNIKLVLPAENVNLGRQGTVRTDATRQNMPKIKQMLAEAGLIGQLTSPVKEDDDIISQHLETPLTDEEKQEYVNKCKGNSNYLRDSGFNVVI